MPAVKEGIIQMIQNMPQDISVEDVMAELYFRYQVDEGIRELGLVHRFGQLDLQPYLPAFGKVRYWPKRWTRPRVG